ncbi:MFS transporter [Enterococcus devriesei]|uniref:MFS transporter n=1 Tax=Enterococcus devriesei TaxID=319970 RepID=UPI001C10E67B|nr:MFS transporter [Enterococcus devriesei]MBU5365465.1 MFS transporter [Enterococcus devriesei]MDT2822560.1 MFS transporter [Enterococcus devriesei]
MKNKYLPTAIGLYINYIIHGMGVIIISQNQKALMGQWNTDLMGVAKVISMLGIGRLIAIMISGRLSDKFGRKPFIYLGIVTYSLYFFGILYSQSVNMAMVFAVIAGISNSFLDSGTYPALMESFPKKAGTANVLIKAFVQIGQFALPIMLKVINTSNMWFGWSFVIPVIVFILNGLFLLRRPFPDQDAKENQQPEIQAVKFKRQPKIAIEGVCFIIYGFISQATFYLISQFIGVYGEQVANMSADNANLLISYYSTGSLICVAVTAALATRVRPIYLVTLYTFISFVTISIMWLFPSPTVMMIGAGLVGFFAAGGVMQLGLTVMGEMFPAGKGTITGIFYTFGSIASFLIPIAAAAIAKTNVRGIMFFDTIIAGIGFVLAVIIFIRYRSTVDLSGDKEEKSSLQLTETQAKS